jgi:hypothetical protein
MNQEEIKFFIEDNPCKIEIILGKLFSGISTASFGGAEYMWSLRIICEGKIFFSGVNLETMNFVLKELSELDNVRRKYKVG